MILKRFDGPRGRLETLRHESQLLQGNPLGDPWIRDFPVYLPAAYDEEPEARFPVIFDLVGYTGSGWSHVAWKNFSESVPERLDRLMANDSMGPTIVVFPDCFTALGGNQYINSTALGPYADYLVAELVPFVDSQLRTLSGREHRGVFGKSSGGYGALVHGMLHSDTWSAIACHSGDLYFDLAYWPDLPKLLSGLAPYGGDVAKFLEAFHAKLKPSGDDIHALMLIAMAATYDPDPDTPLGFHLPVDSVTGRVREDRWQRWLEHDPVRMVAKHGDGLRKLSELFIDCGTRDQYHLHYGARIFVEELERQGIAHHYEEFDDNHSGIDYRFDVSLPRLWRAIRPQ